MQWEKGQGTVLVLAQTLVASPTTYDATEVCNNVVDHESAMRFLGHRYDIERENKEPWLLLLRRTWKDVSRFYATGQDLWPLTGNIFCCCPGPHSVCRSKHDPAVGTFYGLDGNLKPSTIWNMECGLLLSGLALMWDGRDFYWSVCEPEMRQVLSPWKRHRKGIRITIVVR